MRRIAILSAAMLLAVTTAAQATTYDLSLFNNPANAGVGTVTVTADVNYMYLQWVVNDGTDARLAQNTFGSDQTSVNINPSNVIWGSPNDILFQTGADANAWGGTSSGTIDGWMTQWSIGGVQQAGLPGDLQSTTTYVAGVRTTDWVIPLASLGLTGGETLVAGGAIEFGNASGNPTYVWPLGLDFNLASPHNGSTYAQIVVQGTVIPEPLTAGLGSLALLALTGYATRRRR